MASYFRELERGGILPAIRSGSTQDERLTRSPSTGCYGHRAESTLFQPRPPSAVNENKRQMQEIQDQMKAFREELQKKDALIQQLVSMESVPKSTVRSQADSMRFENLYCGDRQALDGARSELAAVQVKAEKQQNKIKELENEINIRDVRIKELHYQMDTSRENETRLQSVVESLHSQVTDLKGRAGAFESVAGRSEYTVVALQKENKAAQERIVDLETRQRKQLEEREEAQARVESLDRKLKDVLSQFASILKVEPIKGSNPSVEEICRKLTDQMEENAMLRGKMLTLTETVKNSELETKASRETIMCLVSEISKEQKEQSKYISERDSLRPRSREHYRCHDNTNYEVEKPSYLRSCLKSPTQHRDGSHSRERDVERCARKELEREVDMLKERLDASQRTIDAQWAEMNLRDSRLSSLDRELHSSSSVHSSNTQFILFREHLSNLLADIDGSCQSGEDFIKCKVESLVFSYRDLKNTTRLLEERVKQLNDQLESQYELHKTAAARARKAESEASELHKQLQSAKGVFATGDVLRGGFRYDNEQYMHCLLQLGEAMKMDRLSLDLGMEMAVDALIARAQQLVNIEKDSLDDKSTHIYNLQRKVKSLKEQLESKDLHIDLLRKKITSLEDKILGKTTIEKESDNETLRMRQIEKLAEKYKIQLVDAQQEIVNLKAQLLDSSELTNRMRTLEQCKDTEELVNQVEELEKLRRKQAHKIRDLKTEIDSSNQTNQDNHAVVDNAVQALSSELRTIKIALSTIQGREKQLIDFRNVVARMLGLDISTLAVPDYEIISRLEKLIQTHHGHTFTNLTFDEDLTEMEDGFFRGYEDYRNTVCASEQQNMHKPRERVKRTTFKARARSCSPKRRIDPKVY